MREWVPKLLILGCIAWASLAGAQKAVPSPAQVAQAEAQVEAYRARNGVDSQLLQFMSEVARAKLELGQVTAAQEYARQTEQLCRQALARRTLDAEPRLPLALGGAIEVQAQAMAKNGNRSAALALLRQSLRQYGTTSLQARLQKNLNLLTLEGRPAPPLVETQYIGPKPPSLSALRGRPVLLFNGDSHLYRSDNPLSATAPCVGETDPATSASVCAHDAGNSAWNEHPSYDVSNFHRVTVHGSTTPLEWLELTVDPSANHPATDTAFGPFAWQRMPQPQL